MSNPQPQPRILGLRFFSLTEMMADKTVWSVRFRSARRTIVRRGTKSDAEKADIKNSSEKFVRILSSFFLKSCLLFNKKTYIRFFVPDGFSDDDLWGEMKERQKRRNTTRRRTIVRQRRVSAVEKAKTFNLMQESDRIPTP